MRSAFTLALALAPLGLGACSTLSGDPSADAAANPLGTGLRIAQVQNPSSPDHMNGATVQVSSAVVTWLDTFDETHDGKSVGTLYIQDVGSSAPYAGIGVYEPNYVPASLTVLPGDVLDFVGPYTEEASIGSATFDKGTFLPQLSKPVGTFRYEFVPPPPATVTSSELEGTDPGFAVGRKWINMLATLNDVTIAEGTQLSGRVTYPFSSGDGGIDGNSVAISNELYNLGPTDFPAGTHFKTVTGIVTWFFSFQIAPRSAADLVECLSDSDCSGSTPHCNTTTTRCGQ
jgi:hypothetical protein